MPGSCPVRHIRHRPSQSRAGVSAIQRRRRDRRKVGGLTRPDQQHPAGRVVDHESGVLAEAVRTQPGTVTVPADDQVVDLGGRGCDHPLNRTRFEQGGGRPSRRSPACASIDSADSRLSCCSSCSARRRGPRPISEPIPTSVGVDRPGRAEQGHLGRAGAGQLTRGVHTRGPQATGCIAAKPSTTTSVTTETTPRPRAPTLTVRVAGLAIRPVSRGRDAGLSGVSPGAARPGRPEPGSGSRCRPGPRARSHTPRGNDRRTAVRPGAASRR